LDIGSLLLILSITILVGFYVSRPFYSDSIPSYLEKPLNDEMMKIEQEISDLMAEKDHLLIALQDLDSDNSLNKIPEEEYSSQRAIYKSAAALILRKIDELDKQIQIYSSVETKQPNFSDTGSLEDEKMDRIEEMISARRHSRNEKSAGFCPHCGKVIRKSDQYCPACGSKVTS
jgi:hypothetical protein